MVKNGTVSEECFPYSSENEIIEECPLSCKDGSELKKYYAKNAYKTPETNNINYYENVEIIIDQIYNYGPVVANIKVYEDFSFLNQSKCKNKDYIYSNYNNDKYIKDHAIVIVGFGHSDSEYYWLIQNSEGPNYCDNGFMKIEFGEIGIENVTFSQPYVTSDSKNEITIRDLTINNKCELKLTIEDNDKQYLDESFEIIYQNSKTLNPFYYQCGVLLLPITKERQINCYYIQNELKYLKEDIYNYEKSNSL